MVLRAFIRSLILPISRSQSGEPGRGRGEVISLGLCELQEGGGHRRTDRVNSVIFTVRSAVAVPEPTWGYDIL